MFGFFKKKSVQKYKIGDIVQIEDPLYNQFEIKIRSYNSSTKLYTVEIKQLDWINEFSEKELEFKRKV